MFQLMIAEDNPFILKELCNETDWEDFDLYVSGSFPNGKALLDAARTNMPDVILTDIAMPIMDGITLATAIRQISSDVKIIYISSYADFEYAQKALSLQISGYILKPFEPEQLKKTMNKVLDELTQENFRKFEQDRSLHQIETLRSIALENYMAELLYHAKENSLVLTQLKELQVTLFESYELQVAAISFNFEESNLTNVQLVYASYNDILNKVRSILYGYPSSEYRFILMPIDMGNIAVLLIRSATAPDTANLLAQLHVDIKVIAGFSTTIGYSRTAKSFSQLMGLFAQANASKDTASSTVVVGYEDIQTENISRHGALTHSKTHVYKMKEYITEHYKEPITMHDVASAAFLSPSYANYCFKHECGCSIFDSITQRRINEAKRLLSETNEPITTISELVGYIGKTNFYLTFKKNVGMSPAEYRKKCLEDE